MLRRILLLALAGATGTLARYWLSGFVQRSNLTFAWGTLAVNGLGCFLFGLVWTLAEERLLISGETRIILLGGFMGAFTTFSTYMFETRQMLAASEWLLGATNFAVENLAAFALLILGIVLGRMI
ncbi:MAG TPA: CrcB family protein [Candidatus Binataceae bacterium]|nr:CrcB family protein [Candidatus Binataceae bacterium]